MKIFVVVVDGVEGVFFEGVACQVLPAPNGEIPTEQSHLR
jgi:hypothetical protein